MEIVSKSYLSVCHAAAYTIVSYQTAWLKCYYPVEFMAALMTSVIDNSTKVAEYINVCRKMNIKLLPPDINEGERDFSVSDGHIRYALSAIKGVGRSVIDVIVMERQLAGPYKSLQEFIERLSGKDVNKRAVENFIKAGAMDSLKKTRRQMMLVYPRIMDQVAADRKHSMTGQMSLFDFVGEENKSDFEIRYPDVGEYDKAEKLALEKEVLGIYVSGHPLEDDAQALLKHVSATATDFYLDEETGVSKVKDNQVVILGGMITSKTVKVTKNNQLMAFVTLEDLTGTVEIIVFPRDYEKYQQYINEDGKIYVRGRAQVSDDQQGRLICEKILPFNEAPKEVWLRFDHKEAYFAVETEILSMCAASQGNDPVVIYLAKEKAVKRLSVRYSIHADEEMVRRLEIHVGPENVKLQQTALKWQ